MLSHNEWEKIQTPLVSINLLLWSDQTGWSLLACIMCQSNTLTPIRLWRWCQDCQDASDGAVWRLFMTDSRLIGSNCPPDSQLRVNQSEARRGRTWPIRGIISFYRVSQKKLSFVSEGHSTNNCLATYIESKVCKRCVYSRAFRNIPYWTSPAFNPS